MRRKAPERLGLLEIVTTPLLCFLALLAVSAGLQRESLGQQVSDPAKELAKFQYQLKRRVAKDQSARIALNKHYARAPKTGDRSAFDARTKKLQKKASGIDEENLTWLKNEVKRVGVPEYLSLIHI